MREIKFRQWSSDRFHYWGCGADNFTSPLSNRLDIPSEQFTGLYDKNGKEIYEGDIPDGYGAVFFSNEYLGYFAKSNEFECEYKPIYDIPIIEIIGNIHETPELLEVAK